MSVVSKLVAALILALALLPVLPATALAHGGHKHLMGTVKALDAGRVQVALHDPKTKATSEVWVTLTDKTKIARATASVPAADIKVGERIVIDVAETKPPYKAIEVKLPRK